MEIRTYLSHSYRLHDQAMNKAIWNKLAEKRFTFSVDPPSSFHQTAHLEKRMLESSCFVAIVPFRRDAPQFHCSPFMLYEIGLAIQARRPKLILVDDRINKQVPLFKNLAEEDRIRFSPQNIHASSRELEYKLDRLRERTLPEAAVMRPPSRLIGLVTGSRSSSQSMAGKAAIRNALAVYSLSILPISLQHTHNALLLQQIDECDAVIMDCRETSLPEWLTASLLMRPVPTIKLVHVREDEHLPEIVLHRLVSGTKMDDGEPVPENLLFWRVQEDLQNQLVDIFERLNGPPPTLVESEKGLAYFGSIGRRKAKIFVSNSGAQREFAQNFTKILKENNFDFFHYKKDIDAGELWKKRLRRELRECDGLIAFIDKAYLASEWCGKELKSAVARKRKEDETYFFKAFNIGNADVSSVLDEYSAKDIDTNDASTLERIIKNLDTWLKETDKPDRTRRRSLIPGGTREWLIDVIRRLPQETVQALQGELDLAAEEIEMVGDNEGPGEGRRLISRGSATRVVEMLHGDNTPLASAKSDEHPLVRFCRRLEKEASDQWAEPIRALAERLGQIDLDD